MERKLIIILFHNGPDPAYWFLSMPVCHIVHSFIHSGCFYSASSSPILLKGAPDYSSDTGSELTCLGLQAIVSEGLAQGPFIAARVMNVGPYMPSGKDLCIIHSYQIHQLIKYHQFHKHNFKGYFTPTFCLKGTIPSFLPHNKQCPLLCSWRRKAFM